MEKFSLLEIIFNKDEQSEIDDAVRGKKFFTRQFSGSVTKRLKRILSTRPLRAASAFSYMLSHISTRAYGATFLTLGLVSLMMYLLKFSADMSILTPIIGVVFAVLSVPFLLADKPLPVFLADFYPTDYLFYELFCMKRHTTETPAPFPMLASVFIGFALAVLSALLPLWQIALAIGVLACVYVGLESPEFVFLVSLFALPYLRFIPHGDIWLAAAILLALVSFLVKVMYGKRVIYIEQYDIFIGVMLLFVLISGVFLKGIASFSGSLRMIALSIGYVLAGNIVTNRRLAERSVNAVVLSGVISALISVAQTLVAIISHGGEAGIDAISFILARQDGMAVFLMASILFAVGMIRQSSGISRAAYIGSVALLGVSLILSGEFLAVTATLVGLASYFILKNNKKPGIFLPLLLILPLVILLLPGSLLDEIFVFSPSVVSAKGLFDIWNNSLAIFANNLFVGIGIGSESFAEEMAALGIFGYPDSSNLFIEIGLEAGIFALLSFFCVLFTRMKHRSIQYTYLRNSQIEHLSCISGACVFCLLVFGMINYIWSEFSAYYFFWCVFGIGSATLRVAKKDYDERSVYYEESSAFDSSVVDIEIR